MRLAVSAPVCLPLLSAAPTEEERLDQMTGHAPNTFAWNTISRGEGGHMFNRGDVFKRLVDYIAKVQVPAC